MASFQIHEDQENVGRDVRQAKNVFGRQNRPVLGQLDNKPERKHRAGQILGSINVKNNENNYKGPTTNKSATLSVPVAQFQAFKVYEDGNDECSKKGLAKRASKDAQQRDVEHVSRASLEDAPLSSIVENVPMSVEKPSLKMEPVEPVPARMRNKDLFFEMEEYRQSIYEHLLKQEKLHRPKPNYMRKQPDISHNMRTILVDWLVEVAEEYDLQTETLYLAVNYIDRFLSFMSVVRAKLQLVGTAAMFIAAKYEEIYPPNVNEFVYITDDTYSIRQVIRMEVLILKVLDFDLSLPTAYTFITAMSIANKVPEKITYLAQYLSELALLEAEPTLEILPSMMGAAAICVARHALGEKPWNEQFEVTTGYKLTDLRRPVEFLQALHKKAESMQQQAIQEKYKAGKYLHVSTIPPKEDDVIIYD